MTFIAHVAIVDDWESAERLGEYEVSTRGVSLEEAGFVHAVALAEVRHVLEERYADIRYELLLVIIDAETLATSGLEAIEQTPGRFRVPGPIYTHGDAVAAVLSIARSAGGFVIPDIGAYEAAEQGRGSMENDGSESPA
jgi:uncharacterized protein (DUF952 family)